MAIFIFEPDKEVQVITAQNVAELPETVPMTFMYLSKQGTWHVHNPKTNKMIPFMQEGVPEIYKAQVLLLTAAYPD